MATRNPIFRHDETHDHDGAADKGQCPNTEAHLGDNAYRFRPVVDECVFDADDPADVKRGLFPDPIPPGGPRLQGMEQPCRSRWARGGAHRNCACAKTPVSNVLITYSDMNVYTTVSLTALPTPCGPPPTVNPL